MGDTKKRSVLEVRSLENYLAIAVLFVEIYLPLKRCIWSPRKSRGPLEIVLGGGRNVRGLLQILDIGRHMLYIYGLFSWLSV